MRAAEYRASSAATAAEGRDMQRVHPPHTAAPTNQADVREGSRAFGLNSLGAGREAIARAESRACPRPASASQYPPGIQFFKTASTPSGATPIRSVPAAQTTTAAVSA